MSTATLQSLPTDVVLRICDHLSVAAIHQLRLAGLGSRCRSHDPLRAAFRSRVAALLLLLRDVSGPGIGKAYMSMRRGAIFFPCHSGKCERMNLAAVADAAQPRFQHEWPCGRCHRSPVDVASFTAAEDGERVATALSRPDELARLAAEMPFVTSLQVAMAVAPPTSQSHRSRGLDAFESLREVVFYRCLFRKLPADLLRVGRLERLVLMRMHGLEELPSDMGGHLPHLRYLELFKTRVTVPQSLWDTLERNCEEETKCVFVVGRRGPIRSGEIFQHLQRSRHPRVHASLHQP